MSNPRLKLIGSRFGRLRVIAFAGLNHKKSSMWECLCDCGVTAICKGGFLKRGATKSCGCIRRERVFKHGMSKTPFQQIWSNMLKRCFNPSDKDYKHYGMRGITPCESIKKSPKTLQSILSHRPNGLTLDRINNNEGYHCGACVECLEMGWQMNLRWATRSQQALNQRRSKKTP